MQGRVFALSYLFLGLLLLWRPAPAVSFVITVDAHGEDCFFDKVTSNTKITLTFEVTEGGFLDIDVKITGPEGKVIYAGERESNGRYTFAAHMDGEYRYCFSNRMSTVTPKTLMFSVDVVRPSDIQQAPPSPTGDLPADQAPSDDQTTQTQLEAKVNELSVAITGIKHEQEYMEVRDRVHRAINESTNQRVVLWSFFEALLLAVMSLGQVYYLKRFFEVRRIV